MQLNYFAVYVRHVLENKYEQSHISECLRWNFFMENINIHFITAGGG